MTAIAALGGKTVDQIGIVVPDLEAAMDGYIAAFGVGFHTFEVDETASSFSGSSAVFRLRFAVAPLGVSSIELIQPVSGNTIYSRFLEERGPGIHHMGVYVADLKSATKRMLHGGGTLTMEGSIRGLGRFDYLDVPAMHAIVELLQLSLTLPVFLLKHGTQYPR